MGPTAVMLSEMADIREAVTAELARRKWSRYRLVKELHAKGGNVSAATLYAFLKGDSDINSDAVGQIMAVLELRIVRKR